MAGWLAGWLADWLLAAKLNIDRAVCERILKRAVYSFGSLTISGFRFLDILLHLAFTSDFAISLPLILFLQVLDVWSSLGLLPSLGFLPSCRVGDFNAFGISCRVLNWLASF